MRRGLARIFDWILRFYLWLMGENIPSHWVCVDYLYILEKLIEAFPFAEKIYLVDRLYYLAPLKDISDFLARDPTDKEKYVSEFHDCDDFSFRLMGQFHTKPYSALAFGIAWSNVHAYNAVVVDSADDVWLVEPQTDQLIHWKDAQDIYETKIVFM